MISAIVRHIVLLFLFRHDGRGLPGRGPIPYLLLTASALLSFARNMVESGDVIMSVMLVVGGYLLVVLAGRKKPHLVAPVALVCLGGDSMAIVALGFNLHALATTATLWQVAAIVGFISRRNARGLPM